MFVRLDVGAEWMNVAALSAYCYPVRYYTLND